MKLENKDIELIINRIIEFLKAYNDINIEEDYYWKIDESEKYKIYDKPTISEVGSLHDDLIELKKLTNKNRIVTPVDLDRLSAVLSNISFSITNDI